MKFSEEIYLARIFQLEAEYGEKKKLLERHVLSNKILCDDNQKLKAYIQNLSENNKTLINSNKNYQENTLKLLRQLNYFKGYKNDYLDLAMKSKKKKNYSTHYHPSLLYNYNLNKLKNADNKNNIKFSNENETEVNVSILNDSKKNIPQQMSNNNSEISNNNV